MVSAAGTGSIQGHIVDDINGSGDQQSGVEPFIIDPSGPLCTNSYALTNAVISWSGPVSGSTTANLCINGTDGYYDSGAILPDGIYTVRVLPPTGWTSTNTNPVSVTISGGGVGLASFFIKPPAGLLPPGNLIGRIIKDDNGNGIQDNGELFIADPTCFDCGPLNYVAPGFKIAWSGPTSGSVVARYSNGQNHDPYFDTRTVLAPGTYSFSLQVPAGWVPSAATSPVSIFVGPGVQAGHPFFAKPPAVIPSAIQGVIWQDTNGNGIQDNGEPNILDSGASTVGCSFYVQLSGFSINYSGPSSGTTSDNKCSLGQVYYEVSPITAGTYSISVITPPGWIATSASPVTKSVNGNSVTYFGVKPPALTVDLTASPSSGPNPLNTTLSASVTGAATGTINYSFWWNCTNSGTDVNNANGQCGTLTTPAAGSCVETAGVGYKCNGVNTNPQSAPQPPATHTYTSTSTAKVIVERGSSSAEDRQVITITSLTPPPAISLSPGSLSFSSVVGTVPNPKIITISDSVVGTTLNWTAASDPSSSTWCHVSQASGTTANGSSSNINVSVDAFSGAGTFNCTISVSDPIASNNPQTVSVVYTVTVALPVASSVTITPADYCASGPAVTVGWTYSDQQKNPQQAFQIQVDDSSGSFASPIFDSGKLSGAGNSYFVNGLPFNATLKARVKVWDSPTNFSNWANSGNWSTPKHSYPRVDFNWSPINNPAAKQPINFSDLTTFYDVGGSGQQAWSWNFGDGGVSTLQNPVHSYSTDSTYNVTDTVTDKDGYVCARSKTIGISKPIPIWREVSPK